MLEFLEKLSSSYKFVIVLLIYTAYLGWWTSAIVSNIEANTKEILENRGLVEAHTITDYQVTIETIRLSENVKEIANKITQFETSTREAIEQHAKCGVILDNLIKRIEKLESNGGANR